MTDASLGARQSAEKADAGASDSLDAYARSISRPRMLTHEEIIELSTQARKQEVDFSQAMAAMPPTARGLVSRWRELRDADRVTGLMGRGYRDNDGRDWTRHIDACMARLEEVLARGSSASRDRSLRTVVLEAEINLDLMMEIFRGFQVKLPLARQNREHFAAAAAALDLRSRALQRVAERNLRLVMSVVKRYRNLGVPFLDLIQEGNLGLIRAAEKFDPTLGYRFSTYAVWWIEQAAVRAVQNHSRTVRTPSHLYDIRLRYKRMAHTFRVLHGREPAEHELVESLGLKPEEVRSILSIGSPIASLQQPTTEDQSATLEDSLVDEAVDDPIHEIAQGEMRAQTQHMLKTLKPRERYVVERRFGLTGEAPLALAQIGQEMGLSRERVRQIQTGALERMRGLKRTQSLRDLVQG